MAPLAPAALFGTALSAAALTKGIFWVLGIAGVLVMYLWTATPCALNHLAPAAMGQHQQLKLQQIERIVSKLELKCAE